MNKQETIADTGQALNQYRECVEAAHVAAQLLETRGYERPWIVIKCERKECSSAVVIGLNGDGIPSYHTHRIRLEIR